jgi:hypothetical protein
MASESHRWCLEWLANNIGIKAVDRHHLFQLITNHEPVDLKHLAVIRLAAHPYVAITAKEQYTLDCIDRLLENLMYALLLIVRLRNVVLFDCYVNRAVTNSQISNSWWHDILVAVQRVKWSDGAMTLLANVPFEKFCESDLAYLLFADVRSVRLMTSRSSVITRPYYLVSHLVKQAMPPKILLDHFPIFLQSVLSCLLPTRLDCSGWSLVELITMTDPFYRPAWFLALIHMGVPFHKNVFRHNVKFESRVKRANFMWLLARYIPLSKIVAGLIEASAFDVLNDLVNLEPIGSVENIATAADLSEINKVVRVYPTVATDPAAALFLRQLEQHTNVYALKQPLPVPEELKQPLPVPAELKQPLPVPAELNQPLPVPAELKQPLHVPAELKQPLPVPAALNQPLPVPAALNQPLPVGQGTTEMCQTPPPGVKRHAVSSRVDETPLKRRKSSVEQKRQ